MANLTCELNGRKYLLMEYPISSTNEKEMNLLQKKYEIIIQGVGQVFRSFWKPPLVVVKMLVPEEHVIAFNKES